MGGHLLNAHPVLDVDAMLRAATETAGVGTPLPRSVREGLEVLVESLPAARLNELGVAAFRAQVQESLSTRLGVEAWAAQHRDVGARTVRAPVFILGMPRTGTTLLHSLLAQDPKHRVLRAWECHEPVPPVAADTREERDRVARWRFADESLHSLNPALKAIHHETEDGPTECLTILAQDFRSWLWDAAYNPPRYGDWLLHCDHSSAYRYHHQALRVLQGEADRRWVLKSPQHSLALPALVAEYPDARFVMTHRDPATAVASMCSLVLNLSRLFSDADHRTHIASHWTEVLALSTDRVIAMRDARPEVPFHDVQYGAFVSDPMRVLAGIYEWLEIELTSEVRRGMREHLHAHPGDRFGQHEYSSDDLLIDRPGLEARFAAYRERFEVRADGSGGRA